jgi:hypothetical protein
VELRRIFQLVKPSSEMEKAKDKAPASGRSHNDRTSVIRSDAIRQKLAKLLEITQDVRTSEKRLVFGATARITDDDRHLESAQYRPHQDNCQLEPR